MVTKKARSARKKAGLTEATSKPHVSTVRHPVKSGRKKIGNRAVKSSKAGKALRAKPLPLSALPVSVKTKIPKKYRALHAALMRLRERITGQIDFLATDNLKRSQNDTEPDFRSEEQGTDNFDRDFALNRVSLDQDIIFEIDEALNRIQMGTYGICESCGRSIEKARMAALPYSRMCVACQSKSETSRKNPRSLEAGALFPNIEKSSLDATAEEE